jgi:hypothetical protein
MNDLEMAAEREQRYRLLERQREEHMRYEGRGPVNEHPDGCWNCGSPHHHTTDCDCIG